MALVDELTPGELERQLDEFEEILLSIENPKLTSLNEDDIELLSQIKSKLDALPTTSSFDMRTKAKISPLTKSRKLGDNIRSNSQKVFSVTESSPRFVSKSELQNMNATHITLPLVKREKSDKFKFEEIFMSMGYFSEIIKEKALYCERFRIASINSDISIKTADYLIKNFSQIVFDASGVVFVQKNLKSKNGMYEVYGFEGEKDRISKVLGEAMKGVKLGDFVSLSEDKKVKKEILDLLQIDGTNPSPLLVARKFREGDSENIFLVLCPSGENSILQMLYESCKQDPQMKRYMESALIIASRILYQFTTDTINKNLLFFDLLDIENVLFAHSKTLLVNMLVFTYRDDSLLSFFRKCDQQYQDISKETDLLLYQFQKTSIIFKKFEFAIMIKNRSEELYSFSDYLESIMNELIFEINKKQSNSQAMLKAFHKDLTKVIMRFDMDNRVINQTRHFFPFMEREFRAPYILSNFDPTKEVTLLDITKNQDLRQKLISAKDKLSEDGIPVEFEFKKTLYAVHAVFDPLHLCEQIGYMVTVESNSEKLLESIMQNRLSLGKELRLNFNDSDDLQSRINQSIKFLNQIYGVSKNMIEKILKNNIDDMNIVVDNVSKSDDNVTMMMSEYMRPEFTFRKKKDRHSRRSSVFVPNAKSHNLLPNKNRELRPRKKSLKFTKKLDIETITKSYRDPGEMDMANSPIDSPGGKALKKMSRFALIKKSREPTPTELSAEVDSLNSISRFNSARKIEVLRAEETPKKGLTVRSNSNHLDINSYVDISHLDYTTINHVGLKKANINFLRIGKSSEIYKHVWAMLSNLQIVDNYHISPHKFTSFIKETHSYYERNKNPFHNFRHGVTVMNQAYSLFKISNLAKYFTQTGITALAFAGLMHDIDHSGKNNLFEINSWSKLAVRYNDNSVLENHHSARTFKILEQRDFNIFEKMHQEDYPTFRKYVIHSIMSTDIKKHFTELPEFKERLDSGDFTPYEEDDNIKDFLLMIGVLLHCCDLYTPVLPWNDSVMWSMRLNREFRTQSEEELDMGIPLTPFLVGLDDTSKLANSEKGFIGGIVTPLWLEVDRFLQGVLQERLKNIENNVQHWEKVKEGEEQIQLYEPEQENK